MYTVVGGVDVTDYIPPDSEDNGSGQSSAITSNASLSDPNSTWDFELDDINQTLNIKNAMPVIVFDENAPAIGNVPTVPTMNLLLNPILAGTSSFINNWAVSGFGISSAAWSFLTANNPKVTVSNAPVGFTELQQFTTGATSTGAVEGVEYMFSIYQTGSGTINNITSFIQMTFLDASDNFLSPVYTTTRTPTVGEVRVNVSGVAPVGAVSIFLEFGINTTNATNSGSVVFGTAQYEPMWFANKGVSYPTPDCNVNQVNSILMPDGTTSRACRRFAGYVENRTNSYVGTQRHTVVQCASTSKILETIGLFSYSATATQDTTILSTILSTIPSSSNVLSPIGRIATGQQNLFAPTSTLIPGVIIDSISWNNATLRQILNDLGSQSGSLYYVDAYYYLWYVPPSFAGATVMLSDTPDNVLSFPYSNFSIEYDFTNPVNNALVVGSKQKAAVFTETFSGNGSTTVFNLTYPPENVHGISISAVTVRTGVDGVDNAKFGASLTYKALINKQAQTLKFATAPASGSSNISISYTYEDQVISQVIAADAVAAQNCQFWGLVNDSAITSTPAAKNRGLAELASYAFDRVILTFDLLNIYMPVGSLALFTNQSEGFTNAPFVIQTVQSDLKGGGQDNWQYTAGVYNPTIIDHLRNATKAIQKSPTTANVVVIASIDVALFDSLHVNDSMSANVSNYASELGVLGSVGVYYRMGETFGTVANDLSGNGNNGTLHGGITLNQTGALAGDANKAMLFDGSTGYITLPSGLNPAGWSAFTISLWIKSTSISGFKRIVSNAFTGSSNTGFEVILNSSGTIQLTIGNGATNAGATTSSTCTVGVWSHFVGTYDGSTIRSYFNGVAQGTAALAGTIASSANLVDIGRNPAYNGDFIPATVDEVAIQFATLTGTQITALYNAGI